MTKLMTATYICQKQSIIQKNNIWNEVLIDLSEMHVTFLWNIFYVTISSSSSLIYFSTLLLASQCASCNARNIYNKIWSYIFGYFKLYILDSILEGKTSIPN